MIPFGFFFVNKQNKIRWPSKDMSSQFTLTRLQGHNIQKAFKFGGGSLMVRDCFKGGKVTILRKIEGTMIATV